MIKLLVLSGLGALVGCATTYDVVQVGPETYQVSASELPTAVDLLARSIEHWRQQTRNANRSVRQ
jgi:hypothetical protein